MFPEPDKPGPPDKEDAVVVLSDADVERIVSRLHQIIGPLPSGAAVAPRSVAASPETARHCIRLGATGLTCVAQAEPPGAIPRDLARFIDHTLLKPDATEEQVRKLCAEALEHNFRSVCIHPTWVSLASRLLHGSEVLTCTVVGFPLGANEPEIKALEARRAIRDGAQRDRHGDQHRGAQERRRGTGPARHSRGGRGVPRRQRGVQGDSRDGAPDR